MENETNKQNADGPSTRCNIHGHLPWIFPCTKMGTKYHLLPYRWWISTRIKPATRDEEHLFIIGRHDVLIIDRHDFIINVRQVNCIGVVNIASWACIMSIKRSWWFPWNCDSATMATTHESASKRIRMDHYQNWPKCDRQNLCRLGVYGNESGWCWMAIVRSDHHEFDPKWIFETWYSSHPAHQRFKD